jgi:hypothetical protein
VLWLETVRRRRNRVYTCRCTCGSYTSVTAAYLRSGGIRSCGCLRVEAAHRIGTDRRYADYRFGGRLKSQYTRA